MTTVAFLHTAAVHVATFQRLVDEHAPSITTAAVVDESLLAVARTDGPDSAVLAGIDAALDQLVALGATTIVCTCSTIAGQAEKRGTRRGIDVIRVDRPMAEAAVSMGPRITVLAALESTVQPTTALLEQVAASSGTQIEVSVHLCAGAWDWFQAGEHDRYVDTIARACDAVVEGSDVLVLAQTSMAPAARKCSTSVPVLSSPGLAVRRALAL